MSAVSLDPLKPYADLMRTFACAIAVILVVALLFVGGVYVGRGQRAGEIEKKNGALLVAAGKLSDAQRSLGAAGTALRKVNDEARTRIEQAAAQKRAADQAAIAAASAAADAKARLKKFERKLELAKRNPDCDALLSTDVLKVCGL
ncbi:hypothetical protein ACHZ97_04250 [Lysobacter soli]|uniref:hypothetical protein n=1 Tax=Lysobacter soli TaxID=453783 RepID=UPI0037C5A520